MKRKYQILMLALFGVSLIADFAGAGFFDSKSDSKQKETLEPEPFIYDDHGRRDPFWPLVTPSGSIITHEQDLTIADLILEGILTESDDKNTAIINGRILNSEDAIGSFVIKDITADTVILQKGKQLYTLKLKKED